jgi:Skp family chaperone for outer membrane proteins
MRRAPIASISLSVALAFLALSPSVFGEVPSPSGNDHILRIAVVRVGYVYRNMQEFSQSLQNRKNRITQVQADETKRRQELDGLVNQLEQFKKGSPQWYALRDTIDNKKLELESWGKKMQLELDRENKKGLMDQYRHVNEAAQTIAEQQHLDLVVSDYTPEIVGPDFDGIPQQQLEQLILTRAVLFADKKADITQEVLTLVDANFAKEKQAVGAAPMGPGVPPAPGVKSVAPNPAGH